MNGFRLTEEFRNQGFSGGTINATPLGHAFDVGAALEAGGGVIVTEDDVLANVLRSYPALEEVSTEEIPEGISASVMPGRQELGADTLAPPTLQSGAIPEDWQQQPGAGEIPAEHADEPATPEGEIQAGEAVSGSPGGTDQPDTPPDPSSNPDEGSEQSGSESRSRF